MFADMRPACHILAYISCIFQSLLIPKDLMDDLGSKRLQ